jgi:hypothetical protein
MTCLILEQDFIVNNHQARVDVLLGRQASHRGSNPTAPGTRLGTSNPQTYIDLEPIWVQAIQYSEEQDPCVDTRGEGKSMSNGGYFRSC